MATRLKNSSIAFSLFIYSILLSLLLIYWVDNSILLSLYSTHLLISVIVIGMYRYSMIDSDEKYNHQMGDWKEKGITSFAIDFEGEFNLHIYGEHLCLIQLFDGSNYFLIDPFKVSMDLLIPFFTDTSLEKIMFDASSDASLLYKQYGIEMKGVYDVALAASLIGFTGNYSALVALVMNNEASSGKKGFQKANWLTRPISPQLIEYALKDVEYLFSIKEYLAKEINLLEKGEEDVEIQKGAARVKKFITPGWKKLPGFRKMNKREIIYLKWLFESRDMLAKEHNLPAYRVLDKRLLVELAKNPPANYQQLAKKVSHPHRKMEEALLSLLMVGLEGARKEIEENVVK
ncbi:MAG: 3'-5' exonuclease [Spirochaetia bacterium]|nr:3'-5' exonuclease [Spirochaetia bacterium]